jgi:Leucine-rich repeat (LRR) protein
MQLIKRRIKEIGQPIDKITEMDLSGNQLKTFTPEMKKLLEQCKNLQTLILCECDLVSL